VCAAQIVAGQRPELTARLLEMRRVAGQAVAQAEEAILDAMDEDSSA
jgi:hypothetical protein